MTDQAVKPFRLEFSNRVIEHLGIKLYQNKPTNVVAEFLSNCWDADATDVEIDLKAGGDGHPSIVITDNGRGMNRDELTDEFLIIARDRRKSPGDRTPGGRLPMGRKGIGKLAGFGIARTIDVVSSPNAKARNDGTKGGVFYWLRFYLKDIIGATSATGAGSYTPTVKADGVDLKKFKKLLKEDGSEAVYGKFLANAESGAGGVCVYLSDTTLKRTIDPDTLLKSMGRRFTVTMLRKDFVVKINGKSIGPADALPTLYPFGFGDCTKPHEETVSCGGEDRTVRFWVRFVSLKDSEWPIENAGVGVYAHGKIAQDRPFFFDVRGKEIFSRYLYGVVEADWLDELPNDVISTDRRSLDWETDATEDLHKWGTGKISAWLEGFQKWRAEQPKTEIVKRIREVSPQSSLTGAEEEALAELLTDVLPSLGNDDDAKNKTTLSFTEAWTHAPTRALTKKLWNEVFAPGSVDAGVFAALLANLRKSLVPEAMGLAVTMAQRVAAITAMNKMIEKDKTETHLQRLIETFPWLLGPHWEPLTANQTIRTLVTEKHKPDTESGEWSLTRTDGSLKPDFVFLSDIAGNREFVVFELKGPECGKTLQPVEYEQLAQYLRIIRNVYTDKRIKVSGVLVGHDKGGFDEHDNRITVRTWSEVLLDARGLHASYLTALLHAAEPSATDMRLKQIADFGGKETIELIKRLESLGGFPPVVSGMFSTPIDGSEMKDLQ